MSDLLNFFGEDENNQKEKKVKGVRPTTLKTDKKYNNTLFTPGYITNSILNGSPDTILPLHTSFSCSNLSDLPKALPPENPKGNIEYKRQLLNLTPLRMQHLITQLKWRLEEGQGEAIYEIGVEDDGRVSGLDLEDLSESVTNLRSMADTLHASLSFRRECNIGTKKALEILIRNMPTNFSAHETRVAILGNMDAGKSTLIGVLTQGILDDGQGKTRLSTFRHIHEVRSGRTSSISCQLLGFDADHNVRNYYWQKRRLHQRGHEDVASSSERLISLIDLAGCWKYQRTTLFALTSRRPHYAFLVISASHVLKGTAINHFQLSEALKLPIAIIITKTDRCSPDIAVKELSSYFKERSPNYYTNLILTKEDAKHAATYEMGCSQRTIPIFPTSCVSGEGIDIITTFLGALHTPIERYKSQRAPPEVWIDQMHSEVPRVNGCVVVGLVHNGSVYENDFMYLGPQKDGHFVPVIVKSIHRNRLQHYKAHNSQFASFAVSILEDFNIKSENRENQSYFKWLPQSPGFSTNEAEYIIQRGMVLLGTEPSDTGDYFVKFRCEKGNRCPGHIAWGVVIIDIKQLDDEELPLTEIQQHPWSWIIHCGNVYQKCQMLKPDYMIDHDFINNLTQKKLIFRFNHFPQFIHCDDTFVFHRLHKNMKAHGSIQVLLGKFAFQKSLRKKDSVYHNGDKSPIIELDNNASNFNLYRGRVDIEDDVEDDQSSEDDYVTAPSSPILI